MKDKKNIIIFFQFLFIAYVFIVFYLFVYFETIDIDVVKQNQEIKNLNQNFLEQRREILNFFYSDKKNDFSKKIDQICEYESEEKKEICLIKNILSDFEKQENNLILKEGIINMRTIGGFKDSIKFYNLIFFKKRDLILDEYCTENKRVLGKKIHIVQRDIFNASNQEINEFISNNCFDKQKPWVKTKIYNQNNFLVESGHVPGQIFLYDFDKFTIEMVSCEKDILSIQLISDDKGVLNFYKKYIVYFSQLDVTKEIIFNSVKINFWIDMLSYKIKKVSVIDDFILPYYLVNNHVENHININFFYNKTINLYDNEKLNYSDFNVSNFGGSNRT